MKNLLLLILLTAYFHVSAQQTYVPDDNFEQTLIDLGYDDVLDDYVLTANIDGVISLDVSWEDIFELTGIEDFTSLTTLDCGRNNLTFLDISNCTALTTLVCAENSISSLNLSQNSALTYLVCYANNLTTLDVSQNTLLTSLNCGYNEFTSLDFSNNTELKHLNCEFSQLASLNLSQNSVLTHLVCNGNDLTTLDVSQNTLLTWLSCQVNQLSGLDISENTALVYLTCHSNQLNTLDVSQCTALTELRCAENQLATLDVTQNSSLIELFCDENQLTSLNLTQNVALQQFWCLSNQLTHLDIRNGNNSAINTFFFNATDNPDLTCIFVDDVQYSTENWTNIDPASTFVETQAECDALGIDEEIVSEELQVYPNPVTNTLNIDNISTSNIGSLQVYNVLGKLVLEAKGDINQLDVSSLKSGAYVLKIETEIGVITKKVVKE